MLQEKPLQSFSTHDRSDYMERLKKTFYEFLDKYTESLEDENPVFAEEFDDFISPESIFMSDHQRSTHPLSSPFLPYTTELHPIQPPVYLLPVSPSYYPMYNPWWVRYDAGYFPFDYQPYGPSAMFHPYVPSIASRSYDDDLSDQEALAYLDAMMDHRAEPPIESSQNGADALRVPVVSPDRRTTFITQIPMSAVYSQFTSLIASIVPLE